MSDSENKSTQTAVKEMESSPVPQNSNKKAAKHKTAKKRISAGKIFLIIILVLILALVAVIFIPSLRSTALSYVVKNKAADLSGGYTLYTVQRRDITTTLTGTGTLQPYDSYNITATVSGDILKADFEEMDEVEEDRVLYVIDSSDIQDDIDEKKKDVDEAWEDYQDILEDYADLAVTSDFSGIVRELYVEVGDKISEGTKIAYVVDSETMVLEVPFFATDTDFIRNGTNAVITFSDTDEVLEGTVTEISNITSVNSTGSVVRNVKISVHNPGGIYFGMPAYAYIPYSSETTYYCAGQGTFSYNEEDTILSTASGEIVSLSLSEGGFVSKGGHVLDVSSETLDNQAESAKKAYDNQVKALNDLEEKLEDYTIKAPIAGTVVQKNYKYLDTIGSNSMSSTTTLAIIYDMSKLTFEMSIDELDLGLIQVGQKVNITSDSMENETFEGIVTKKSIVGSSSGGTTVYPVTVEIDGNDKLLPGMNINAEIIISSHENVLTLPVEAILRGNRVEKVKEIANSSQNTTDGKQNIPGEKNRENKGMAAENMPDKTAPDGKLTAGTMPENATGTPGATASESPENQFRKDMPEAVEIPDRVVSEKPETEIIQVETGASNDEYVEIVSGLEEGDVVIAEIVNVTQNSFAAMFGMGGMGGMTPGGMGGMSGPPSGGMNGGMSRPSSGMGGR